MSLNFFLLTPGRPFQALNAANTAPTTSQAVSVPSSVSGSPVIVTWENVITGTPASLTAYLQASLDGVNFFTIDTSTNTGGEIRFVANSPAIYYQVVLNALSGGSAPTVTTTLMVSNI